MRCPFLQNNRLLWAFLLALGLGMGVQAQSLVNTAQHVVDSAGSPYVVTPTETDRPHGYVGLRPLPRYAKDLKSNHGGSWAGMPTFAAQAGNYPFVAEHLDVVKGWLDGDFKTKRVFFEYYWGLSKARDDLDPKKNLLVKMISNWES
ncbi:MAG: hypothetical protein QGG72_03955, partial [Verrucomicrobiota bacterium]|nr:hypothetical protein [Verrucomicrobiota bacterium]